MLMQLGPWITSYTQNHIVVQAIIREAKKENISLQTLYDCGDEIRKDYASRNSLCVVSDDVPVAQILQICTGMSTELSGIRELLIQNNQTMKAQERQLKENKVNQLETQAHLRDLNKNLVNTHNIILNLKNEIHIISKMKVPVDISTVVASKKRSKPEEKVHFYF
jgi:DNA-binding transcriptional MerR regulator